jgi:cell division protein FtsL
MTRLNTVLVIALVASSLYLVRTAYDARRLYTDLDRAKNESAKLEVEYKRLEAERQAAATNARIERTARERLAMRTATPAVTVYVQDAAASDGNAGPPQVSVPPSGGGPGAARTSGPTGTSP